MVGYCKDCNEHRNYIKIETHTICPKEYIPMEYTFAYCEHCKTPSLFLREDYGRGFEEDEYYRLYPVNERLINFDVPEIVKQSYEEAVKSINASCWIASVVMVGRALEAVCKDAFPESKNVYTGLKKMKEKGLISEELLEWSNELRVLRNMGAHASDEKITAIDATEALDFLQAILEIFYHLRPKFNKMKERRASIKD